MPLSVREWTRLGCGVAHDRDENAAQNIASKPIVYGPLEAGLLLVEAMSDMGVGVSWRIVQLRLRPEAPPFWAGCFTGCT